MLIRLEAFSGQLTGYMEIADERQRIYLPMNSKISLCKCSTCKDADTCNGRAKMSSMRTGEFEYVGTKYDQGMCMTLPVYMLIDVKS